MLKYKFMHGLKFVDKILWLPMRARKFRYESRQPKKSCYLLMNQIVVLSTLFFDMTYVMYQSVEQ